MRRVDVGPLGCLEYQATLTACDRRMRELMRAQERIAQLETELATTKLELSIARTSPTDNTCLSPRQPPTLSPREEELTPVGSLEYTYLEGYVPSGI